MTDHVIETERLTTRSGDRLAVDALELTIRREEVYGFLGVDAVLELVGLGSRGSGRTVLCGQ